MTGKALDIDWDGFLTVNGPEEPLIDFNLFG
jgi:hypothetical protein